MKYFSVYKNVKSIEQGKGDANEDSSIAKNQERNNTLD
jgi:hypothetical protein